MLSQFTKGLVIKSTLKINNNHSSNPQQRPETKYNNLLNRLICVEIKVDHLQSDVTEIKSLLKTIDAKNDAKLIKLEDTIELQFSTPETNFLFQEIK